MHETFKRSITGLFLILGLSTLYFFPPALSLFFLTIMGYLLFFEWKIVSVNCKTVWCRAGLFTYFMIPFLLLIALNHSPNRILLIVLFLMVFSFDTGAYCTGRLYGKNLILPTISPKKSWEGLLGGIIASVTSLYVLTYALGAPTSYYLPLFSINISFLAFLGDMFESFLKRRAKLKDSGALLPGHGGILDRFDSILPVSYVFFLAQEYIMTLLNL